MTIQLRGDTAANWTSANPVLANRQVGLETDTRKMKVGDGSTAWNSLSYWFAGSGTVTSVAASGGTTGLSFTGSPITTSGTLILSGTLGVANGGTGATTLTGYVKGSGTSAFTASATVPTTDLSGTLAAGQFPALTGDVTTSAGSLVTTIAAKAVTLAKMADVATGTVFYRKTAGTGAPEVQTLATLKTDLGLTGTNSGDQTSIVGITGTLAEFNAALTGADFATGGGTATGTNTGDQTITLTGDVTGSGTGSFAATIALGAVTNAKMANVATATFKGRTTAGTGAPEDLTATQATALLDVATTSLKGLMSAADKTKLDGVAAGATANLGTVTSVSGTGSVSGLTLTGTVTSSGNITLGGTLSVSGADFASQAQNRVLASPDGASGAPAFRKLVLNDFPTIAANSILGNNTGGVAVPAALTGTQTTALLDTFTSSLKGLAPASGGGTTNFLRADGTWAAPAGGGGGGGLSLGLSMTLAAGNYSI